MFGSISGAILLDIARRDGYMYQLSIETAPMFEINTELLRDLSETMSYINTEGERVGYMKSAQHPSVKALWDHLYKNGYVEKAPWSNGDVVLKEFYINRYYFNVGDKFLCSGALKYHLEKFMKTDEYKRRGLNNETN